MPDYEVDVKGDEFLDSFVDPGPAFDPAVGPTTSSTGPMTSRRMAHCPGRRGQT